MHRNSNLNWYGVYKEADQYRVKTVEINYNVNHFNWMTAFVTSTKDNKDLIFCFGSDRKYAENKITGTQEYHNFNFEAKANQNRIMEELGLTEIPIQEEEGNHLQLRKNGKQQILNPTVLQITSNFLSSIDWIGDLDGDKQDDYIIAYGGKPGFTVLYLSTEATEDEIVKPVAIYHSTFCC